MPSSRGTNLGGGSTSTANRGLVGSSTTTIVAPARRGAAPEPGVLRLRATDVVPGRERRVVWTDETVDNEGMGKKKSKICCIYHKPRAFDESSSSGSSGSSDSDSNSDSDSDSDHTTHSSGEDMDGPRAGGRLRERMNKAGACDHGPAGGEGGAGSHAACSRTKGKGKAKAQPTDGTMAPGSEPKSKKGRTSRRSGGTVTITRTEEEVEEPADEGDVEDEGGPARPLRNRYEGA